MFSSAGDSQAKQVLMAVLKKNMVVMLFCIHPAQEHMKISLHTHIPISVMSSHPLWYTLNTQESLCQLK